jgi:hypothetical protein
MNNMVRNILPLNLFRNTFLIRQEDLVDATFKFSYNPVGGWLDKLKRDTRHGVCYRIVCSELVSYTVNADVLTMDIRHNGQVIVLTCKEILETDE